MITRRSNRITRALAAAVGLLAMTAASSAHAQRDIYIGQTEIGYANGVLLVGDVIPADEQNALTNPQGDSSGGSIRVKDGVLFGVRLARNLSYRITMDGYWSYTMSELVSVVETPTETVERTYDRLGIVQYGVGLAYYPFWTASERVGGFIRGAIGGVSWRPSNDFPAGFRPLSTSRTSSVAGTVGGGLTVYATEDLSFKAEYAYTLSELNRDKLLALVFPFPTVGPRQVDMHRIEVGFTLRFFDTNL